MNIRINTQMNNRHQGGQVLGTAIPVSSSVIIALTIACVVDALFFAFFFNSQTIFQRNLPEHTRIIESHMPVGIAACAVMSLFFSSLFLYRGSTNSHPVHSSTIFDQNLFLSVLFGTAFPVIKVLEWTIMVEYGHVMSASPVDGIYYFISGSFLIHVLIGLGFLVRYWYRKDIDKDPLTDLEDGSSAGKIWWHYLTVLAFIIFFIQYI